jgi:hypothetical protein
MAAATLARSRKSKKLGREMAARVPIIPMTIISSMRVTPWDLSQ